MFDFPYNNAGWSFKAKISYLDYPKIKGVFFLTQYSQDVAPIPVNNEELAANFQGLSSDGKFYIGARFAITHKLLPKGIDFTDDRMQHDALKGGTEEKISAKVTRYMEAEKQKVENLPDDSFEPSVGTLKKLISSISAD